MDYSVLIAKKDADFNEEQTKHALVLPVIDRILGWDIYNDLHLIPEFTADTPGKNGEKVDYALDIQGDGNPEVLIEVKPLGSRLNSKAAAQLYRYFSTTNAKIAILTDGFRWMLYSDLDRPNIMDDSPFMDFDLEDLAQKKSLEDLFKFISYKTFNADYLRAWGESARDTERLRELVKQELLAPSEEFSRYFFSKLHPGSRATANRLEVFRTRLADVLNEQNVTVAPPTEIIEDSAPPKPRAKQRRGYFQSNLGHKGVDGNLRKSWVTFWSEVAKDESLREKLLEAAVYNNPTGVVFIESVPFTEPIGHDLFIYYNLSSERRIELLNKLSEAIGITSEVVYTDLDSETANEEEPSDKV